MLKDSINGAIVFSIYPTFFNRHIMQFISQFINNDTITKLNGKLYDSEVSFSNIVSQSPVGMMLVKGDDYIVSMINSSMLELLGKDEDIIGKPLFKEIPELKGTICCQPFD